MKPKVIYIKGIEHMDLMRELRNLGYKDKRDFNIIFRTEFQHKGWLWCDTDDIVLVVINRKILQDKKIRFLLLEYLI